MPDQSDDRKTNGDTENRFARLADSFVHEPGVTLPNQEGNRGFGSSALKVDGSIFAMLTRGHLVVKLPRKRVTALIEEGTGGPFDAGKGTPMKEWLTVWRDDENSWHALAREAHAFVSCHA